MVTQKPALRPASVRLRWFKALGWRRVLILKCHFVSVLLGLKLHHEADWRHATGVWRHSVVTLRHWGHVTNWHELKKQNKNEARAVFMWVQPMRSVWAPPALQLVSGSRHRAEFTGHLEALWSRYTAAWHHGKYERCGSNGAPAETVISHHARLQHHKYKCHTAKPSGADTHFLLLSFLLCFLFQTQDLCVFSSLLLFQLL